jgi:hypothetical protein
MTLGQAARKADTQKGRQAGRQTARKADKPDGRQEGSRQAGFCPEVVCTVGLLLDFTKSIPP